MTSNEMMSEIREANLTYLMLAQQMIRADKASATFRLGINQEMADLLSRLTPAQILKMAQSEMLLCRFRFDDRIVLGMLSGYSKDRPMTQTHSAIMLAGQAVEDLT